MNAGRHVADPALRQQIRASLNAAKGASSAINPGVCHRYVRAWDHDLAVWREHRDTFPSRAGIGKALARLGLAARTYKSAGAPVA